MLDVLSIHIGKTAGSAFRHVLSQVYGDEHVLWDYEPDAYRVTEPLPDPIQVIHGHFAADKYRDRFPEAKRIVWLRNPVMRLISEYFFAQIYKDIHNPLHVELISKGFELLEFAEQGAARNIQANQVRGVALTEFYFVGIQEFYTEDLADLQHMMQWPEFTISRENMNPHPHYSQDLVKILYNTDLVKQLARWNQEDMELYQQAIELRAARRGESMVLQHMLSGLRQSQPLIQQFSDRLHQLDVQLKHPGRSGLMLTVTPARSARINKHLIGFCIDSPVTTTTVQEDSILIEGWALGAESGAIAVRIFYQKQILVETPINLHRPDVAQFYRVSSPPNSSTGIPGAESSGFSTRVFIQGLRRGSSLLLQVLLADGQMVNIGKIQIRAAAVEGVGLAKIQSSVSAALRA
ncbi:MAG: hypothetical protein MUF49_26575 [Oculatellaceae cyanobacterium Prado106]|jgi:hypothetical protein|nr:hypothetical protein [Oculatellaceae cyanobacterium Prado106]